MRAADRAGPLYLLACWPLKFHTGPALSSTVEIPALRYYYINSKWRLRRVTQDINRWQLTSVADEDSSVNFTLKLNRT